MLLEEEIAVNGVGRYVGFASDYWGCTRMGKT